MLERVITVGQSGEDQAAWRAAKAADIPTGGAMPKGFLTEEGSRPEFADLYGAHELATTSYALRTEANVRDSHATLWLGNPMTRGGQCTLKACREHDRRTFLIRPDQRPVRPSEVVAWIGA